ncbi:DUF4126 domain-containing protein [Pseudoclavibacter helvolus]|uniref:DUF4126 domain-containing protein n=1 Tax=Pseudoclavibacter helvolus TaxID=255205 RepID=UPI0037354205
MFEVLSGLGLATSSGMNAYLPALTLGLLNRFTSLVELPPGWAWIGNEWVLLVLGVLVVFELVADKIPGVDHVNDIIQTAVRPASGGIVFGAGTAGQTGPITDVASFFTSGSWVPVAIGVAVSLVVHAAKVGTRAAANVMTGGTAAPVLSAGENGLTVGLIASAILAPVLVVVFLALMIGAVWVIGRAVKRFRSAQAAKAAQAALLKPVEMMTMRERLTRLQSAVRSRATRTRPSPPVASAPQQQTTGNAAPFGAPRSSPEEPGAHPKPQTSADDDWNRFLA